MVHKKIILIVLLIVAIFVSGCAKSGLQPTKIKVGTWKTAQTIQPFLYEQYIESNNTVEVVPFTNPGDQKTALLAGNLDACGTTLVTAIFSASKGEPIKVICNLANKCSALVVGYDSDINNVEDLKGKTIAYVPGTMHHILLLETLERAGLDPDKDVVLKRIDFFDMGQALANSQVDAFCSGEPYPSIATIDGYGKVLVYPYYDESIGYINGAIISTQDIIMQKPEIIQKLVTAHVKTTKHLLLNRDEWLTKAAEFGTDSDVLELAAENMDLAWDITPEMIDQTKNLAIRMKELKIISKVPDIEALFDLTFLKQARN